MARVKKGKIQSEAPRYNLKQLHKLQPTKINSPPENKNKYKRLLNVKTLKNVLSLFVTECQRAIKIHYQKEVAMKNFETVPNLLANHKSHQEHPPKSVPEPPERSRHDPTYVECLNHPE